jgi:hypothetical protein
MDTVVKSVKLDDGRVVTRRPGKLKVRDVIDARRQAGKDADEMGVGFAIIARMIHIDDKAAVYEDILDFTMHDIAKVQEELLDDIELPGKGL